jgi:hypothetical protein
MNEVMIQTLQSIPRMPHNSYVFHGRNPGQPLMNGIENSDWKKYIKAALSEDLLWQDLSHTSVIVGL